MNYFSSDFKLGVLGGGQLGKMLLYETRKLDIYTCVLDKSEEAPGKQGCNEFYVGDLMDFDTVMEFGKKVDLLTIEIENINIEALQALEKEGKKVFPSYKTLELIQNKARQKLFYVDNNIPTAEFSRYAYTEEINAAIKHETLDFPFVWKSAQYGYDGQGVKIIKTYSDLEDLPNVECITEKLVDFKTEIAVIVARRLSGEIAVYPVVEMEFHPSANQVEYVICPGRMSERIAKKAQLLALKVSSALNHVGLLAVEMFLTKNDEVLVNEVAPRPHNSGHYSIEGSYTNQFEQHIRAILNLPLGNTESKQAAVMVNLVGGEGYSGKVLYQNLEEVLKMPGVTPHIYGKKLTRPFRKMGHITIINKSVEKARKMAEEVKRTIQVISN